MRNINNHVTVGLFIPTMGIGGAQKVMLNLAAGLTARGYHVDLVVGCGRVHPNHQIPHGVSIVPLGASRTVFAGVPLARYLREHRPAVLLSTLRHGNIIAAVVRRVAAADVPLIVREATTLTGMKSGSGRGFGERCVLLAMRYCYAWAEGIVANSKPTYDDLVAYCRVRPGSIRVIHNPVVEDALLRRPVPKRQASTCVLPPLVLGAGRLVPEKGFETLVRAVAEVAKCMPVRLRIFGEGPEQQALGELVYLLGIEHIVEIRPFVANLTAEMRRAAVFASTSKWEGFGNVIVEALAAGVPVVATACPGGPSEILGEGRWGRLAPVGDYKAVAHHIIELIGEPPPAEVLRSRAADFSIGPIVSKYLDAFETWTDLPILQLRETR